MQPDQDKNTWQPPTEQPAQAPYVVPPADPQPAVNPVATLSPDDQPQLSYINPDANTKPDAPEPVRWRATEYIMRDKNTLWFVGFAGVTLLLMALAIFAIKDITFAILVPVMAAAMYVYTQRAPRQTSYTLSSKGLHIDDQLYPFTDFKGFGVIRDEGEYSVLLIPIKRFRPSVSVYFPEDAGEAIVDMLGVRLPMTQLHLDPVDKLIRKLRI